MDARFARLSRDDPAPQDEEPEVRGSAAEFARGLPNDLGELTFTKPLLCTSIR